LEILLKTCEIAGDSGKPLELCLARPAVFPQARGTIPELLGFYQAQVEAIAPVFVKDSLGFLYSAAGT
jgi:hypothetical protein